MIGSHCSSPLDEMEAWLGGSRRSRRSRKKLDMFWHIVAVLAWGHSLSFLLGFMVTL